MWRDIWYDRKRGKANLGKGSRDASRTRSVCSLWRFYFLVNTVVMTVIQKETIFYTVPKEESYSDCSEGMTVLQQFRGWKMQWSNFIRNKKYSAIDRPGLMWGSFHVSYSSNIEQLCLAWALLSVSFAGISSENHWVGGSFLLTNRSQWSLLRYVEVNETE